MTAHLNEKPFQSIREAANSTGFSQYFLRAGCKNGSIPNVKVGEKYLVNIPAFLQLMDQQSRKCT